MQTHNLGYPRIGSQREFKKASEQYWAGAMSVQLLLLTGKTIRHQNWQLQKDAGIDLIPCNDFSFYDRVHIRGQIVRNLDVIINYAYTEAKVTKDSDPNVVGNQVEGTTRHVQNSWLNYKVDRGTLTGLGISIGYQYQVKRSPWYVFDNSEKSLPDYFRLDGSLSYQKEKISFNLVVN